MRATLAGAYAFLSWAGQNLARPRISFERKGGNHQGSPLLWRRLGGSLLLWNLGALVDCAEVVFWRRVRLLCQLRLSRQPFRHALASCSSELEDALAQAQRAAPTCVSGFACPTKLRVFFASACCELLEKAPNSEQIAIVREGLASSQRRPRTFNQADALTKV